MPISAGLMVDQNYADQNYEKYRRDNDNDNDSNNSVNPVVDFRQPVPHENMDCCTKMAYEYIPCLTIHLEGDTVPERCEDFFDQFFANCWRKCLALDHCGIQIPYG